MPRYIDADEIWYDLLVNTGNREHPLEWAVSQSRIDRIPTIDVVERKKGKWIHQDFGGWHCSECGKQAPFWCFASTQQLSAYCQNCGAEMRGDAE